MNKANKLPQKDHVTPLVDVLESGESFRLVADLPGVPDEALDISVDKRVLTLHTDREDSEWEYHRTFKLPDDVDLDGISASLHAGTLTIELPKGTRSRVRKVALT